jgi:hypothetical protein
VAGAAAGQQCDLAGLQLAAADELVAAAERHEVAVRSGEAIEAFGQDGVDAVHELFHGSPPDALSSDVIF